MGLGSKGVKALRRPLSKEFLHQHLDVSYRKLAKNMSEEEARRRIQRVMPSQVSKKSFQGSSPSVFVGSSGDIGVLSPPHPGNTEMLDNPKQWYSKGLEIEKIASLRTSLINNKSSESQMQKKEIAMARKPVDVEVELDSKPIQKGLAGRIKPVSGTASLKELKLGENPSVDKKIEKAFYDKDLKAETALNELEQQTDVYSLQQAFSTGLFGEQDSRKAVPTRMSITAVDDQLSKKKRERVKQYQEIGEKRYFRNEYLGNTFHIFLIPGRWEYELLEIKRPGSTWNAGNRSFIAQNYESFNGRTDYAEECAGAYYTARLGALEYLESIRRQAKVLIFRDVKSSYWAPLGVWVIRETVRNAFDQESEFESIAKTVKENFRLNYRRIKASSRLMGSRQSDLSVF